MPFSFDQDRNNTEFEIIEILDDYEYKYGFEYNETCIVSEWMYRKNIITNRTTKIFERTNECGTYKEQIPEETLVLSFSIDLN